MTHPHPPHAPKGRRRAGLLAATALALILAAAPQASAATENGEPSWRPQASERLVKLPASYLKKSLDQDFSQSELGQALKQTDTDIGLKTGTLTDLQAAIETADGDVAVELRHQFLAEKRAYIDLVVRKHNLRRKHLGTKQKLLDRLLAKMGRETASLTPARADLMAKQDAARQRFQATISEVDVKLVGASAAPESTYAREYAKNLTAIETLSKAIGEHAMNARPQVDGRDVSRQDYLRGMIGDIQAETALLDQEETMLGFMAKLVALDATALSEQVFDTDLVDSDVPETVGVTGAVGFFVSP